MRLSRLAVNELRQFSSPFELIEFAPGLNLIAGANETGKSSLVRALQAAFFERYSTKSVADLRPWQDSNAAPEIQVDFEHDGKQYRLLKRFLKKSQCSLRLGADSYEGDQAEDMLQKLLGFSYPGKGASKEEYWGIPGLLWITQGSGQDLARPISHAHDFLRETLSQGLEEMTTSGGDALVDEIAAERSLLLTQTGKPTGELKRLAAEAEEVRQALAEIEQKAAQYQQAVDRLAQVRSEHQLAESKKPWEEAERKKIDAARQLEAVNQQRDALARSQTELAQAQREQQLLLDRLRGLDNETEQLDVRTRQVEQLRARLAEAESRRAGLELNLTEAEAGMRKAEARLARAQRQHQRRELEASIKELQQGVERARTQLQRARDEQAKRAGLQRQLAQHSVEAAAVDRLVARDEALRKLVIQREAVATRIRYQLDAGKTLSLGDSTLSGEGEATLIEASVLALPGVGRLTIEPGGQDLATLASRERDARRNYEAELAALKVGSVTEARRQLADRREAEQQLQWLDRTLADLAPKGLDALAADLESREVHLLQRQGSLEALGHEPGEADDEVGAESAADALKVARQQHEALAQQRQRSREDELTARAQLESAETEQRELAARIQDPARQEAQRQAQDRLLEARALVEKTDQEIARQQAAIEAANPRVLEDDIQRLGRAADAARATRNDRLTDIARLEGELRAEGAASLGEEQAALRAKVERLDRHHSALELRAGALDLLYRRLQQKRTALVERLQAPLQKHVAGYLRLLFPEAEMKITEAFQPGRLFRNGAAEVDFESLSFGAREQVGVILRLAYADALKEAGRPTLIVLDDALVHSDRQRRDAMQRVLYNAAHRHQILLFTCHPDNWVELGVPVRALEQLKAESGL